jgi:Outer membrane protein beta-barrel domain
VKRICRYLTPLSALLFCVPLASAQSSFDLNVGFGAAHVGSNGSGIDNISSANAFGTCTPSSGDAFCQTTPGLSGFMLGLGGDLMLNKRYGFGAEVNFQPGKSDYGPLQYRQTFYDFNGIFAPVNEKRVQLQLQGGIGGARTGFSYFQNACVGTAVCTSQSQPVGNANHFQVHAGVGVQFYLTQHLFVRPQFDYHYVPNLTQQFGSNSVPEGTIWLGYSFGER